MLRMMKLAKRMVEGKGYCTGGSDKLGNGAKELGRVEM